MTVSSTGDRVRDRLPAAVGLWGPDAVRPGTTGDAVDGDVPGIVLEPTDRNMVSAMLRWANTDGVRLVIRGHGTKLTWASVGQRPDAVLSTIGLVSGFDHQAGDLTAVLPAGMSIGAANDALKSHQQWLPLDPASPMATIGGLVATNDSGPHRHRFGTVRDLIIGVDIALADGRLAQGGGRVVKNVAGYDLPRLMCGSFGSLGVVVGAIFKLSPIAGASQTVVANARDAGECLRLAGQIGAAGCVPSTLEVSGPPFRLLIRFESIGPAVQQQANAVAALCEAGGAATALYQGDDEAEVWRRHRLDGGKAGETSIIRISVVPTKLAGALAVLDSPASPQGLRIRVIGRLGVGVLVVQMTGAADARAHLVAAVRSEVAPHGGHLAVIASERAFRERVDPWGPPGDAFRVMRSLKQQFDPNGILNPGRGPGGL